MRGRKPKPTHQRILEGNRGKRPINRDEPELPPADADAIPLELEAAAAPGIAVLAVAEWRRLAPILIKRRALTTADRAALVALCLEWARYVTATTSTTALLITTKNGHTIPNPYLAVAGKALAACARLWPELGLTPSSRSRVHRDGPPAGDPFAEFDAPPTRDELEAPPREAPAPPPVKRPH
jgi:P27 family predicted phage terminase small subunit